MKQFLHKNNAFTQHHFYVLRLYGNAIRELKKRIGLDKSGAGFTLIELLIVIGVLAILATVSILVINPAQMIAQSRDARRLTELKGLNSALSLAEINNLSLGVGNTVYVSLPGPSNCSGLGLPDLPVGWFYACSTSANYKKVDGSGWIPVNFNLISSGSPFSVLPVDPVNAVAAGNYYTYVTGGSYELTAVLESDKQSVKAVNDGDAYPGVFSLRSSPAPLTPGIRDRGLVGYWKLDEASGALSDSSGYGNNGTQSGGVAYGATGKVGNALSFDGVNDYVDIGNNLEWPGALTFLSWHQRTTRDTVNADGIFGNWFWDSNVNLRKGWTQRYYINTDSLCLLIELTNGLTNQETQPCYTVNLGNWYLVAGVFSPADRSVKLYVDGELRSSATGSTGFNQIAYDSPYPMRIGYNPVNGGYFSGFIDEARIYNRALSAAEIKAIYEATK